MWPHLPRTRPRYLFEKNRRGPPEGWEINRTTKKLQRRCERGATPREHCKTSKLAYCEGKHLREQSRLSLSRRETGLHENVRSGTEDSARLSRRHRLPCGGVGCRAARGHRPADVPCAGMGPTNLRCSGRDLFSDRVHV